MKLSPHFTIVEFVFSDYGSRNGIDNTPNAEQLHNLCILAGKMEEIRRIVVEPIIITSAFRSKAVNSAIGGSATSSHMDGLAADWYPLYSRDRLLEVAKLVAGKLMEFDQVILEGGGTWIHCGFGPKMRRETLTNKPGQPYIKGLVA